VRQLRKVNIRQHHELVGTKGSKTNPAVTIDAYIDDTVVPLMLLSPLHWLIRTGMNRAPKNVHRNSPEIASPRTHFERATHGMQSPCAANQTTTHWQLLSSCGQKPRAHVCVLVLASVRKLTRRRLLTSTYITYRLQPYMWSRFPRIRARARVSVHRRMYEHENVALSSNTRKGIKLAALLQYIFWVSQAERQTNTATCCSRKRSSLERERQKSGGFGFGTR